MNNVLSFGAGTQSTGLLLMYLNKVIDEPLDLILFADTGSEPYFVYEYLDYFNSFIKKKYGREVTILKPKYGLEEHIRKHKTGELKRSPSIPYYTENGIVMRQCTVDLKIVPINAYARKHYKIHKKRNPISYNMIMGISFDERERMRISQEWFRVNKYPLVEMGLRRNDVIKYIKEQGLTEPPRSSCYFCPFHSDNYWNMLKKNYPEIFKQAVDLDKEIRVLGNFKEKLYLSKHRKPLDTIDFDSQMAFPELIEECEGYCGV